MMEVKFKSLTAKFIFMGIIMLIFVRALILL